MYYYLLALSFGAAGNHIAMPKTKHKNIYKSFSKYSKRLQGVMIENMNFEKLIKEYDNKTSFFYCDPPYVGTETYYKNTGGFDKQEHELFAQTLSKIKGKFLVSYNDCNEVRELYADFSIIKTREIGYSLAAKSKHKVVQEVFITNYDINRSYLQMSLFD